MTYGRNPMFEKGKSQNIVAVNRIYKLLKARDLSGILDLLSQDVRITQSIELPWGGTWAGIAEARMFFEKMWVYVDNRPIVERFLDGGDHIVALGRSYITVSRTGRTFEVPFAHVWGFRDGTVYRVEMIPEVAAMREVLESLDS